MFRGPAPGPGPKPTRERARPAISNLYTWLSVPATLLRSTPDAATLFDKVWDLHAVRTLPTGQTQLFIGLHLIHEVTSPQAFDMLRARGWRVRAPERTFATVDHIVPTRDQARPFPDAMAEEMMTALERNCREFGIPLFDLDERRPGHRPRDRPGAGPDAAGHDDRLRRQPHVARTARSARIAFGIGTSQVRDVLASQCLAIEPLKVRRIDVNGTLAPGRLRQGRHPRRSSAGSA